MELLVICRQTDTTALSSATVAATASLYRDTVGSHCTGSRISRETAGRIGLGRGKAPGAASATVVAVGERLVSDEVADDGPAS